MVVEIKQPKINKYKVPHYKGHLSMCPQMSGRMDHPVTHARLSMDIHARLTVAVSRLVQGQNG